MTTMFNSKTLALFLFAAAAAAPASAARFTLERPDGCQDVTEKIKFNLSDPHLKYQTCEMIHDLDNCDLITASTDGKIPASDYCPVACGKCDDDDYDYNDDDDDNEGMLLDTDGDYDYDNDDDDDDAVSVLMNEEEVLLEEAEEASKANNKDAENELIKEVDQIEEALNGMLQDDDDNFDDDDDDVDDDVDGDYYYDRYNDNDNDNDDDYIKGMFLETDKNNDDNKDDNNDDDNGDYDYYDEDIVSVLLNEEEELLEEAKEVDYLLFHRNKKAQNKKTRR
jgi:hypothetical protein